MRVDRRDFLGTTTAFTSINLYHPRASAGLDMASQPWHQVWFRPGKAREQEVPAEYSLADTSFLNFDAKDRWKIANARPGYIPQDRTTHIFRDVAEYIPTENVGLKELLLAIKHRNPELDERMTAEWLTGNHGSNVARFIASYVGQAYGIDTEGRKHGRELWEELERAVESS